MHTNWDSVAQPIHDYFSENYWKSPLETIYSPFSPFSILKQCQLAAGYSTAHPVRFLLSPWIETSQSLRVTGSSLP